MMTASSFHSEAAMKVLVKGTILFFGNFSSRDK